MDCYDTALRYSKERVQFGRPIAGFQLQQKKLAEMITEITKGQLLFGDWQLKNEGRATAAQISMAKRNSVETSYKHSPRGPPDAWAEWELPANTQ
jgi:glutaryl-CoA dehydrogenase